MDTLRTNPTLQVKFRRGEPKTLELVYRAYVEGVRRQVQRWLRRFSNVALQQPTAVADIVQDVFVRAFSERARHAYDSARDYGAYLTTIARNCVFDALREQRRHARFMSTLCSDTHAGDVEADGAEACIDPRVRSVVSQYLAQLSERSFAVYQQRFVFGATQGQASAALGVTRAELRTREGHLARGLHHVLSRDGLLEDGLPI